MEELVKKVEQWSIDKGIKDKATLYTQWSKMNEECQEVREAISAYNYANSKETHKELCLEIGDVAVTAVLMAQLAGTDIEECLQMAYDKISKRTGKMIDGMFYKSEDINSNGEPNR